ncbi:SPOR domain-containing protein [Sphingomonas sanguinis]|uniref:SPOR domain-containing protein n=1 Tax=Sphingomonas sanguinis TaxID=33051 RepID=UPI001C595873|nr:SPOR domain-containing protein [Sphingomonas sanguinis]QXT36745.1 SPOR domain-containing protein [Sphingomonas sanguinis]
MTKMTTFRTLLSCSVGMLILAGCTATGPRTARLKQEVSPARATAALADQTRRVLAQRDGTAAVALAERLVAADPRDAGYRSLLGQSYLQAGRFASARQAFTDALQLDPADGRAALNLALAMIAGGNGEGARTLLDSHASVIPAADLGLALALAGAPGEGVRLLTAAAREPGASVKARQNLALALALSGQWDMARMAASADMAPADVEVRMREWADFAANTSPADRVSSLLGVKQTVDTGQPITLALNGAPSAAVVQDMVQALPQPDPKPAAAEPAAPGILFAARQDVVQPLPMSATRSAQRDDQPQPSMERIAAGPVTAPALLRRAEERRVVAHRRGDWNVQIGAFGKADGAQKAWGQLTRRFDGLSGYTPQSGTVRLSGEQLYRLSVGGLSRADADSLCHRYRAAGGACFVRRQADDHMAQWARPGIGIASL